MDCVRVDADADADEDEDEKVLSLACFRSKEHKGANARPKKVKRPKGA